MEDKGIFPKNSAGQKRRRDPSEQSTDKSGKGSIIVSVVENRAREICICRIDTSNVQLPNLTVVKGYGLFYSTSNFNCRQHYWRFVSTSTVIPTTRLCWRLPPYVPTRYLRLLKSMHVIISVDYMHRRFCYMMAREERLYQRKSRRSSTPLLELFTLVDK